MHRFYPSILVILTCILLIVPLAIPLLQAGIPATGDAEIHLHRMVSAQVSWQNGDFYPRWSHYLHHGYGYPLFNYYAPAVYLFGAMINTLTGLAMTTIMTGMILGGLLLYPFGAYLLGRRFLSPVGALILAALYTYAPFRLYELWVQMNLPQFIAMGLIPFVLWAVHYAMDGASRRIIVPAGLIALLTLTHHITAFLAMPFIGVYGLILIATSHKRLFALCRFSLMLVAGVALATIYWLPALGELNYTQINTIQDGQFSPVNNLTDLQTLINGTLPIDRAQLNWERFGGAFTPRVGWVHVALAVLSIGGLIATRGRKRALLIFGIITTGLTLFLMTDASRLIWENAPLIGYVQFPWRLTGIALFAAALCSAILADALPARMRSFAAISIISVSFMSILPLIYAPVEFQQFDTLTAETGVRYEMRTGNMGLTASNEYLPRWSPERPQSGLSPDRFGRIIPGDWFIDIEPALLDDGVQVDSLPVQGRTTTHRVISDQPTTITFMQLYFPGWDATLNGEPATITPDDEHGRMTIDIPAGTSTITLTYAGTPLQHTATWISLLTLAGLIALAIFGRRARHDAPTDTESAFSPHSFFIVGGALIAFVILNQVVILPHTDWFRPAGDPTRPPAQKLTDIVFSDQIALRGYDLNTTMISQNGRIVVDLYWQLLTQTPESLRGSVQIVDRTGATVFAEETHFNLAAINTQSWPLDQYAVDRYTLTIPPDTPPFVGQLQVIVFTDSGRLTVAEQPAATLTDIRITGDYLRGDNLTPVQVQLGDAISVTGVNFRQTGDQVCLQVRWQVTETIDSELTVLLHQIDDDGGFIQAEDRPPFSNQYATSRWQNGQQLDDDYCFVASPAFHALAFGLYQPDGTRLPVRSDDLPVIDNTLRFEPAESDQP